MRLWPQICQSVWGRGPERSLLCEAVPPGLNQRGAVIMEWDIHIENFREILGEGGMPPAG